MTLDKDQEKGVGDIFEATEELSTEADKWPSFAHFILHCLETRLKESVLLIDYQSGREWTGSQLKDAILNVAAGLCDLHHFEPGTAVCISYTNGDLTTILALAVIFAGGLVACAYSRDPYAQLLQLARKVDPKVFACAHNSEQAISWSRQLEKDLNRKVATIFMGERKSHCLAATYGPDHIQHLLERDHKESAAFKANRLPHLPRDIHKQVALILMSSGTTGQPKAVPVTNWNCLSDLIMMLQRRSRTPPSNNFISASTPIAFACSASLDYVSGRLIIFGALAAGYRAVLLDGFQPKSYLETIEKYRVSVIYLGAASFYELITYEHLERYDISSVKVVFPMGAKIIYLDELRRFFEAHRHIVQVRQGFGTSETSGVALNSMTPDEYLKDCENCGHLLPGMRAKIIDPSTTTTSSAGGGKQKVLGVNQVGLLLVRGPTVFPGYYDDQQARLAQRAGGEQIVEYNCENPPLVRDSSVFDDEDFYITGDLAYINEKKQLYIVGRQKELMLCRAGKKVLPQELEEILKSHPAVEQACVLGISSKRQLTLHCPRAFIVANRREFCATTFDGQSLRSNYHDNDGTNNNSQQSQVTMAGDDAKYNDDDESNHQNQKEVLTHVGEHKLSKLNVNKRRHLAEQLMQFVNERVSWETQLTGGIVVLDQIPTSRATGKVDKNYLRSLTLQEIEIYGDRSQ